MFAIRRIFIFCLYAALLLLSDIDCAFADIEDNIMGAAIYKSATTFVAVKKIVFIIGGFGLVGIAYFAIFGRMKWTWFAGLAVGLALLSVSSGIIEYATGQSINLQDTGYDSAGGSGSGYSGSGGDSGSGSGGSGSSWWDEFWSGFGKGFGVGYSITGGGGFSGFDDNMN